MEILVRFVDAREDLRLSLSSNLATIKDVKEMLLARISVQEGERIRLLRGGRELLDQEDLKKFKSPIDEATITIHCVVSPIQQETFTPLPQRRGFDRLLDMGLPAEEIEELRSQFRLLQSNPSIDNRQAEEEWISSSDDNRGFDTSDQFQFVVGCFLGFFFGVLSLFFLNEQVFTKLQKRGIISGLLLNIICSLY